METMFATLPFSLQMVVHKPGGGWGERPPSAFFSQELGSVPSQDADAAGEVVGAELSQSS